jgi:hypothetical protein
MRLMSARFLIARNAKQGRLRCVLPANSIRTAARRTLVRSSPRTPARERCGGGDVASFAVGVADQPHFRWLPQLVFVKHLRVDEREGRSADADGTERHRDGRGRATQDGGFGTRVERQNRIRERLRQPARHNIRRAVSKAHRNRMARNLEQRGDWLWPFGVREAQHGQGLVDVLALRTFEVGDVGMPGAPTRAESGSRPSLAWGQTIDESAHGNAHGWCDIGAASIAARHFCHQHHYAHNRKMVVGFSLLRPDRGSRRYRISGGSTTAAWLTQPLPPVPYLSAIGTYTPMM